LPGILIHPSLPLPNCPIFLLLFNSPHCFATFQYRFGLSLVNLICMSCPSFYFVTIGTWKTLWDLGFDPRTQANPSWTGSLCYRGQSKTKQDFPIFPFFIFKFKSESFPSLQTSHLKCTQFASLSVKLQIHVLVICLQLITLMMLPSPFCMHWLQSLLNHVRNFAL
jgi:hypothetical protein